MLIFNNVGQLLRLDQNKRGLWENFTPNDKNPGLSAGAVPSLARATGRSPESAVPGATRGKEIFCSHKRYSVLLARPDQNATAGPAPKVALLDSRLTFNV